jgi:hypothetical protein
MSHTPLQTCIDAGDTLAAARVYHTLGLSTFPVKADGSKEPACTGWRAYALRLPSLAQLEQWHAGQRYGLGLAGGAASGNLVVLDFETWSAFAAWDGRLSVAECEALKRCPVIGTPRGGAHLYCRLTEPVKGCKLARTAAGLTLVETRGSQHFVVAPGSPLKCHTTRKPWTILRAGWLDGGPWTPMPLDVFHELTLYAVDINEYRRPSVREVVGDRPLRALGAGDRPGDFFNLRGRWVDILEAVGWRAFRTWGETTYWTRPGKAGGVSASTGYCRGPSGRDLFYVFTTSAPPFDAGVSYSRFAVYTLLYHNGDYRSATRALALSGYGSATTGGGCRGNQRGVPPLTRKGARR